MVVIENLRKRFDTRADQQILNGVALSLAAGEYVAIMGESGSGKSTLLNLIAGLDTADSGSISIAGTSLATMNDEERTRFRAQHLGFVFQAFHLLPHLTVQQNVTLPFALTGLPFAESEQRCEAMLAAVGLVERAQSYPRELSGGEMQRVAIARALVHKPTLVLADEPTGNLDARNAALMLELLRSQIKANGASAILVTHSASAATTADRVLELREGRLFPRNN